MDSKQKRLTVEVPAQQHRELKVKLAQRGKTIADWIRDHMTRFLK